MGIFVFLIGLYVLSLLATYLLMSRQDYDDDFFG